MDVETVIELVNQVMGTRPAWATRMPFGHNSTTYDVALPGGNVIVRTNERSGVFARTERNLAILAELGLPVPRVLASDLTQTRVPFAYMILNKIPGRDLRYELAGMTRAQMTKLAEQIVDFQRRVSALPHGSGYGFVAVGDRGPYASWWDLVRREQLEMLTDRHDAVPAALEARIASGLMRCERDLREMPPICFLDDVTVKNVIVKNGELRGLVDFDCVCYGDPLYWMALTAAGVVSDVGSAELFYVEELARLWELTQGQRHLLALYAASMSVWFVRRFAAAETPEWRTRMLAAIVGWINEAEHPTPEHLTPPSPHRPVW